MRRGLVTFSLTVLGLYLVLHLILGSSPVQRRVLEESRRALLKFGLDVQVESIEFSAFSPKIYLNRVTLSSTPNAEIQIPNPLGIDKVKIQFQPLALLSRHIVFDEISLFHPRILLPSADRLYHKIDALLKQKKSVQVDSGGFKLVVKKFGVVDALFNVVSKDPPFAVRSRSLSAFVMNNANEQQTFTIQSNNLELERGALRVNLTRTDIDIDTTKKSLRVNRGIIEADNLSINLKGAISLPFRPGKGPESINASYEVQVPLKLLQAIPELKIPPVDGNIGSAGSVMLSRGAFTGSGSVKYSDILIDTNRIGSGSLQFAIQDRKLVLTDLKARYAGGDVESKEVAIELKDRFPISSDLTLKDLRLEGILESVDLKGNPVVMGIDGKVKATGFLAGPFTLTTELDTAISNLTVLKESDKGVKPENTVLRAGDGTIAGTLVFTEEKMGFSAKIGLLNGTAQTEGYVGFENTTKLKVHGDGLSLTALKRISELELGGIATLNADIESQGKDVKIAGNFDVANGEISQLQLGSVKGQAFFRNGLLSFEDLEIPAVDPVRGNGYVDFSETHTQYRFLADIRKAEVRQIFSTFQKMKLSFPKPTAGEVSGKVTIDGGETDDGKSRIEVTAVGQGKNFNWMGEKWVSSNFQLVYTPAAVELNRLVLLKKSGGVEVQGRFSDNGSRIVLRSHGLRLEELNYIGKAPVSGEVTGEVMFEGELSGIPSRGNGEIKLSQVAFRGNPIPDSSVRVRSEGQGIEFLANVVGEKLKGRYFRSAKDLSRGELLLYFQGFDFAPLASLWIGKDIPTLVDLSATGDLSLKGDLTDWHKVSGSGTISDLILGLKGTPMKNRQPLAIRIDSGTIKVNRFSLVGNESQLALDFFYQPDAAVRASLDGKVDLQFLQPFIPGLEYGTGMVSAGLRLTGPASKYELLGNITLEDGSFRLTGLTDDFRSVQARLSVSQDRLNVDHLDANLNGGAVNVEGDVRIDRFRSLIPNLHISATRATMKTGNYLSTTASGEFFLRGNRKPYLLSGECFIHQAALTRFDVAPSPNVEEEEPILRFDVKCDSKEHLLVITDIMNAEFKGNFHLVGDNIHLGLIGNTEAIRGSVLFRETKFSLITGTVKFESPDSIAPRFTVASRALVKEQKALGAQEYEVNLQVFGTPADYKIRLTSAPALAEGDIISLLLLGVTSRGQEGNYFDLGGTLVGQTPFQSKIQSELGVDIKINAQAQNRTSVSPTTVGSGITNNNNDVTVPAVQIKKELTKKTSVSYSNTLQDVPVREFKIEHVLDENFSVNGTAAVDPYRNGGTQFQSNQSYGVDVRYRFNFE